MKHYIKIEEIYTSRNIETKGSCRDSMLSTCKNIRKADIKK